MNPNQTKPNQDPPFWQALTLNKEYNQCILGRTERVNMIFD